MNVELLLKVKQHILEEPRRLDMLHGLFVNPESPCGIVGCIAGWTAMISGELKHEIVQKGGLSWGIVCKLAWQQLDINEDQCNSLFYVQYWPEPFRSRWYEHRTNREEAKLVVERIDHFIATGV
jgi:hypothetical protein